MKRVKSFKFFINDFSSIVELMNSNIEKRQPKSELINSLSQIYISKLTGELENIYVNTQEALIFLIRQTCNNIAEFYSDKQIDEFSFILCAIADEFILNSSISQKEQWSDYLLERVLFSTSIAGEEIFKKINYHIKMHPTKDNEMSYIFYYTLCLGYKGMYSKEYREIKYLKTSLLNLISSDFLLPIVDKITHISPSNYQFLIRSQKLKNIMDYSFIYKNIFAFTVGLQIIFISYCWIVFIKSKISTIA